VTDYPVRPSGAVLARLEIEDLTLELPRRRLLANTGIIVEAGECVAILGASGSGKTSLLNCVAGISTPTRGSVRINGTALSSLSQGKRSEFRLKHVGIVFQFGELLPELSLMQNVELPLRLLGVPRAEAQDRARDQLQRLGLGSHAGSYPDSLSGGEIQRAGIARALVHRPLVVLADEPTGMLDEENTKLVAELLGKASREAGVTVLMATHDPVVASVADRVLRIRDGRLAADNNRELTMRLP